MCRGQIEEALLDLTGAPCLSVNFNEGGFDSELLWRSMKVRDFVLKHDGV